MKTKILSLLSVVLLTSLTLTGCGVTDNSVINDETLENAEDSVVTLRLWGADEDAELLQIIVNDFMAKYGDQASFDISIEGVSESNCKDAILDDVLNAPDVFTFADDQLSTLAASGVVKPVEVNVDDIKSRNSSASVDASTINGSLYSFPLTADNGYFLFYNKAYFNDEDLTTLDGILKVADANGKQITMDWTSGWYLYSMFGNTGLTVGVNDDGISNYCTWNSTDNAITGVDVTEALLSYASDPGMLIAGDDALTSGAEDGSVIAGVSGVWLSTKLTEIWGDNLGAVKLPTYTVAGQQIQMSSYAGYKMIGVNSYSENVYWAEMLADFITNEDNQALRFEMRGQGPSNFIAASSDEVKASPAIQALIQQSEFSSLQRIGSAYWSPAGEYGATIKAGNPDETPLQDLLDSTVAAITAND